MEKTGVIIIGDNSIRFMLTEIQKGGYFRVIDELSHPLRLCYDLIENNEISNTKIQETISLLKSFKSLSTIYETKKILTFSTNFLAAAKNKDIFLKLIKDELDIKVTILTNQDEIFYNYLAVINSIYIDKALLVDISGESTHIAWILDGAIKDSFTLPLGSVNISYSYNLQDRILKEDLDSAIINIKTELNKLNKIKGIKFDCIIGVGGTVRSIAKLDRVRKRYPFEIIHNYTTSDIDIHDIYNLLKCKNFMQRKRLDRLSPNRADTIVGGALILEEIISYFDISNITVSGRGLKEGIMFDYITKNYDPIADMLEYSLNGIMGNLNINIPHAEHVYSMVKKLFNNLKPLHHLGDNYNNIIKTASYLHDSGISIDYYNYPEHSFYMILNSYINGLTHKELLISASIVSSSHRNNNCHFPLPQYCSISNKLDMKSIDEIGVLLSIAEGLDRSLEGAVEDVHVSIRENSVVVTVFSPLDLKLEIEQALRSSRRFHEVYDKSLIICKE
jgi:exopolyphosphatase/guanosine-5'-triphosphate,3'-diphosphate pyrophosphatase